MNIQIIKMVVVNSICRIFSAIEDNFVCFAESDIWLSMSRLSCRVFTTYAENCQQSDLF